MNKLTLVVITTCAALGLGACAGAPAAEPSSPAEGATADDPVTQAAAILASATPLERQILADRNVTKDEYRRAIASAVSCLESAGFDVTRPTADPVTGLITYEATIPNSAPSDEEQIAAIDQNYEGCDKQKAAVEAVFVLQRFPQGDPDTLGHAEQDLLACLETAGLEGVARHDMGLAMERAEQAKIEAAPKVGRAVTDCQDTFHAATTSPLPGMAEAFAAWTP